MTRPADPAHVASGAPGTASWANSVVDAVVAVLNDIYAAVNLAIPWASLTGVPGTFTPAAHAHLAASVEGQIAYGSLTGIPSTFTPSGHTHPWSGGITGIPATFTPTTAASVVSGVLYGQGSGAGGATTASRSDHTHGTPPQPTLPYLGAAGAMDTPNTFHGGKIIFVGAATPAGAVEGDVWIKG